MYYENHFFFDIEGIPTQNEDFIKELTADIKPPANYKSDEAISKWEREKKPDLMEKAVSESVFDGGMGEIIAFSCALGDGEVINIYRDAKTSESSLLHAINGALSAAYAALNRRSPVWTGHYITGYDLRFLWKRFVINNIKPAITIPYAAPPWSEFVHDTCTEWKGVGGKDKGNLDFVCKAFGIEGKGDFSGADVYEAWKNGEYEKIGLYCGDDVERNRKIFKRMNFIGE